MALLEPPGRRDGVRLRLRWQQLFEIGRKEPANVGGGVDPAIQQDLCQQRGDAGL